MKESLEEAKSEVCSLQSKLRYTLKQRDDLQEALKKYLTVRGDPDDVQEVIAVNTMSVTSDSETLVESDQRKDIQAKDSPDETFKKLYYDSMVWDLDFLLTIIRY